MTLDLWSCYNSYNIHSSSYYSHTIRVTDNYFVELNFDTHNLVDKIRRKSHCSLVCFGCVQIHNHRIRNHLWEVGLFVSMMLLLLFFPQCSMIHCSTLPFSLLLHGQKKVSSCTGCGFCGQESKNALPTLLVF